MFLREKKRKTSSLTMRMGTQDHFHFSITTVDDFFPKKHKEKYLRMEKKISYVVVILKTTAHLEYRVLNTMA